MSSQELEIRKNSKMQSVVKQKYRVFLQAFKNARGINYANYVVLKTNSTVNFLKSKYTVGSVSFRPGREEAFLLEEGFKPQCFCHF